MINMGLDFEKFNEQYNKNIEKKKVLSEKKQRKKAERGQIRQVFFGFVIIIVIVAIVANIVSGYIKINTMKYENNNLNARIIELNRDIEKLKAQIDEKTQNSTIRDIAVKELGLKVATTNQINTVSVNKKYTLKDGVASVIVNNKPSTITANNN